MQTQSSASPQSPVRPSSAALVWFAGTALLAGALLLHSQAPVSAQSSQRASKIAVVDVQKVLTASSTGKAAYEKLKAMQDERIAKAKQMDAEMQKLDADIKARQSTMKEDEVSRQQKELADKRTELQRFVQDADREVSEARDRELQALNARVQPIVDALGKEMGLDAIFNKFESGLVYASDAIDVTDTVIKRINERGAAAGKP